MRKVRRRGPRGTHRAGSIPDVSLDQPAVRDGPQRSLLQRPASRRPWRASARPGCKRRALIATTGSNVGVLEIALETLAQRGPGANGSTSVSRRFLGRGGCGRSEHTRGGTLRGVGVQRTSFEHLVDGLLVNDAVIPARAVSASIQ